MLEREILDLVPPDRNVSIEREVWPRLVGAGLYGFPSESYWMDIGTPERYLKGTFDIIEGNVETAVRERLGDGWISVDSSAEVLGKAIPPAVLEPGVRVAAGAQVGSLVVLGEGVAIGAHCTVERAVILNGTQVGEGCDAARLHRGGRLHDRRRRAASRAARYSARASRSAPTT